MTTTARAILSAQHLIVGSHDPRWETITELRHAGLLEIAWRASGRTVTARFVPTGAGLDLLDGATR